tara:strand:+ start:1854 stop:2690 length:837 start_codon:yes stop_codon:yes gene_type:complete
MEISVPSIWPDISKLTSANYKRARYEAHNAVFWMARGAHSYLEAEKNNKHIELEWQTDSNTLRTRMFCESLQVGLSLPKLEMYFCEDGKKVQHSFWFDDRTPAYVEAWYLVELLHRDKDQSRFSTDLPFHSKEFFLGDTEEHDAPAVAPELQALNDCLVKAADVLAEVNHNLITNGDVISGENPIVCRPEHFTFDFEALLNTRRGGSIVIGLSTGDDLRPAPFFFVNVNKVQKEQKNHALDFNPENILFLKTVAENNLDDNSVINRLLERARLLLSED